MMAGRWKRALALLLACCLTLPLLRGTARAVEQSVVIGTGVREKPTAEITVRWDDAWFAVDADVYQHELAVTAMALSAAAYIRTGRGISAQDALQAFGFDKIKSYNYQLSADSSGQTAYTFAVKTVKDGDGRAVPLVAVIIRGTGEYTEWAGNLNVGTGSEHVGFAQARDELMDNLEKYLAESGVTGKTKFFVTGHSRGGAAANLTAACLTDAGMAEKKDVYAYTFAAPAVSTMAGTEGYENIFNLVNGDDLVPQVPLAQWGYRRYGVDRLLPEKSGDAYKDQFEAMNKQYTALAGCSYAVYQDGAAVEKLTGALARLAPTVSGPNMAMFSALLRGDLEELSALVEGNALAALLMGRTAIRLSSELSPLIQREGAGLAAAHCMAGYYSWLASCPEV
ncbi:MAG: lipase family protein [Oscillospiraceae bacterium]|nr:lipase family protein [Oscillospiraceae bacterium]